MSPDKEAKLHEAFPLLYVKRVWFEHGDGWFDLIWRGSAALEPLIAKEECQCFLNGLDVMLGVLGAATCDRMCRPHASQVKEKFGSLRFYMTCETAEMTHIISDMEHASVATCETCGTRGTRACDRH